MKALALGSYYSPFKFVPQADPRPDSVAQRGNGCQPRDAKMLRRREAYRYGSAHEVWDDLRQVSAG